jgi:hypothetical protein
METLKRVMIIALSLGAIVLVVSKMISGRVPPPAEYSRFSDSVSRIACSPEVQRLIPPDVQPASSNVSDGLNAIAGSDPAAAAQVQNMLGGLVPSDKPAPEPINEAALLDAFTQGLRREGWSKEYILKLVSAKKPPELATFGEKIASQVKTQCPSASPRTPELLEKAFAALTTQN